MNARELAHMVAEILQAEKGNIHGVDGERRLGRT